MTNRKLRTARDIIDHGTVFNDPAISEALDVAASLRTENGTDAQTEGSDITAHDAWVRFVADVLDWRNQITHPVFSDSRDSKELAERFMAEHENTTTPGMWVYTGGRWTIAHMPATKERGHR